MDTLIALLADVRKKNIKLWVDGADLRVSAPPGALTPELIGVLKAKKPELIELLRASAASPSAGGPVPVPRGGPLPATFGQQQLWVLDQLGYRSVYSVPLAVELVGKLDEGVLGRALDEIARRHEGLRTTFVQVEGELRQVIRDPASVPVAKLDLRALEPAARKAALDDAIAAERDRPFDLAEGPLLRALSIRTGEDRFVLMLTLHHIASDGWSIGVLTRELSALYAAFASGAPTPLPELSVQMADIAVWQRERLRGEALERSLRFWRERLEGAPTLLDLPIAREQSPEEALPIEPRGARLDFRIDAETTRGLSRLAEERGATLFMTLMAAFQVLLARVSGQDDVLVGTPAAGRTHQALEPMIGYFVNTLVLRAELGDDPTFADFLSRAKPHMVAAYEHQDTPFERLVEALGAPRIPRRNPLVQVLFALQNAVRIDLSLPGIEATPIEVPTRAARMDLEVDVLPVGDHLEGYWVYDRDRFDRAAMERMVAQFRTLLEGIAADPGKRIGALPLLPPEERHRILVEWNDTAADLPQEGAVIRLFEAQAARTPEAMAVVHDARTFRQGLTYRALNDQANALARHLVALGVGPETLVGLFTDRSVSMVVGMLAVHKAGGAYVPLDPALPPDRLAFLLADTRAPVVLTQAHLASRLPMGEARVVVLDDATAFAAEPTHDLGNDVAPGHLAYVMYTSGSTGEPKGVLIEHHALVAHTTQYVRFHGLTPSDRVLALAAFHFDASVEQIFPALVAGACVILPDWELEPRAFSQKLAELEVTLLDTSGAHWRGLVDAWLETPALAERLRLRSLIVGGDVMPVEVVPRWRRTALSTRTRLFNVYGPTEATVAATVYEVPRDFDARLPRIPIGMPLANRTAYVLDPNLQPVPIGVPGELFLGGIGPARGYLNQPSLTAERFVAVASLPFVAELSPAARRGRVYRTGDRCRWRPDGTLDFLGRTDNQVKIRGYRVELGEIEAELRRHPSLRDAVVVVHETKGHRSLVAYVVPEGIAEDDLDRELGGALRRTLPEHMVPSRFLALAEIPRVTTSGKVDRAALPDPAKVGVARDQTLPRTPTEEQVAAIFCEVLKLSHVNIHDSFFDIGGHSLLATQLVLRVNRAFSLHLPLQAVFENSTVVELSASIDRTRLAQDLLASGGVGAEGAGRGEEGEL
ncbi:non-ribosomal peptide synthetase [Polyangium jinanense]|uniref:Amino acid adenylation domain-containing protein n=1 Tax=Polyangium jinanense TaxID=2829994 RepID=A0A9X3X155_9BACT|nr:amino acid adenylation domain-containing protein [Polyangium jinanense]MDC3955552.1 amino acid adenylation domain-containing protein [Polyangium jinanense]MDC3982194.1 amino acid adenylation domain-containing protein [Polyangium jinanense]